MPIYEYQCQDCGHQLELIQKMSDAHATDCPKCGQPSLKKKVSAAAFRLKGGGWYETDFKSGDKKKNLVDNKSDSGSAGNSSESGSKSSGDGGGAAKSDSKSDSKSASTTKTESKPASSGAKSGD